LSKKKKSGQNVLSGLVKYISVDPISHSQISIKLDLKPNLGMGFFWNGGNNEYCNLDQRYPIEFPS